MTASSTEQSSSRAPSGEAVALGRYLLFDAIARGGMASVHFGRLNGPVGFSRTVAIKRLHPHLAVDPEFVAMLLDEARLAARIRHPNVVPTLDVVAMSGEVFIVMEYVPGESLGALWRNHKLQEKRIPIAYSLAIVAGALHGLHAAHETQDEHGQPLGIVHRDVSPQNVLVGTDGIPRVLDFGVAKAAGRLQNTGESGALKGKVAYMSPEQIAGLELSRSSDIYSASVVLWELLTGRRLVEAENDAARMGAILAIREGKPFDPPSHFNPEVGPAIDAIVSKGLSGDPKNRHATAREMATLLEKNGGLVPATEIGEWVATLAAGTLSSRAERLHQIEASTSRKLSASDPALPLIAESDATVVSAPNGMIEEEPPKKAPRWRIALFMVLLVGIIATALALLQRRPPREEVVQAPAPSTVPVMESAAPVVSSAPVAPSASASASAAKPKTAPTIKPRGTATSHGRANARENCDPPFTIDADGHKVWKRECLEN